MRPPTDDIAAPDFPRGLPWANVKLLKMAQQRGRVTLVEFFDVLRINSLRTLPYMVAWHERYESAGLRVVGIHLGGFPPSQETAFVLEEVERLGIPYPVVVDEERELWEMYGNKGWPARYLWNQAVRLDSYHYGEGAYAETEREIQALLGLDEPVTPPIRPEDAEDVLLPAQTADREGAYSGPYEAGAVHVVVSGTGDLVANGEVVAIDRPACRTLIDHGTHTAGVLELEPGAGVTVHATCFTPAITAG